MIANNDMNRWCALYTAPRSERKLMQRLNEGRRKINCVMRRFLPSSSVGDRPAPRGCTSTPDERKVTTI